MNQLETITAARVPPAGPLPLIDQHFVMIRPPSTGYAGHVGAEVVVTGVTEGSVYVVFDTGIRDCYPSQQFQELFKRQRELRPRS